MWPERTHVTSVPKTEELMHSSSERGQLRRDCQEHRGNLKEDVKSSASREEEIPQEEEDNLNKSSGEDKEMYSWDKLEYKANYVCFISNKSTEKQVQIASAVVNKLEEPVYNHRMRIKERSRPLRKHNDNQPISVF